MQRRNDADREKKKKVMRAQGGQQVAPSRIVTAAARGKRGGTVDLEHSHK